MATICNKFDGPICLVVVVVVKSPAAQCNQNLEFTDLDLNLD